MYWEFIPWTSLLLLGPYWVDFNPLLWPYPGLSSLYLGYLETDKLSRVKLYCVHFKTWQALTVQVPFSICVGGGQILYICWIIFMDGKGYSASHLRFYSMSHSQYLLSEYQWGRYRRFLHQKSYSFKFLLEYTSE